MTFSVSDVTIIIPVFVTNELSLLWLKECIDSAFANKCAVSMYDDGSTVDLTPVLSIYDHDYKYVPKENHGVSYARNRAIEAVTTELILPLDCDDRLKSTAITEMLAYFNQDDFPTYSDIEKFGEIKDPHYVLWDFACGNIQKTIGFSAVSVLHTKAMWTQIGGYDESVAFYEDGLYNARLFGTFCGVRCPKPLLEYRIHADQRTKTYEKQSAYYAKLVTEKVRNYKMACPGGCGGKRRTASGLNKSSAPTRASTSTLFAPVDASAMAPVDSDGRVLAHYVGGSGRGTHYYQGLATRTQYKVLFGQYLYVDERDTKAADDTTSRSLLVKAGTPNKPAVKVTINTAQPPAVTQKVPPVRTPVRTVQDMASSKAPSVSEMPIETNKVLDVAREPETQNLPDIRNMTYRQVVTAMITPQEAKELLKAETGADGLNRSGVKQHLKKLAEMDD